MVMLKCTYFIYLNGKLLTLLYTYMMDCSIILVHLIYPSSFWGKSLYLFCCSCCFQFVKYIALSWINQFNKVLLFLYHKQLLSVWRTFSKVLCLGFYDDESTSTAKMSDFPYVCVFTFLLKNDTLLNSVRVCSVNSLFRLVANFFLMCLTFSLKNHSIEQMWVEINSRVNYPIKRMPDYVTGREKLTWTALTRISVHHGFPFVSATLKLLWLFKLGMNIQYQEQFASNQCSAQFKNKRKIVLSNWKCTKYPWNLNRNFHMCGSATVIDGFLRLMYRVLRPLCIFNFDPVSAALGLSFTTYQTLFSSSQTPCHWLSSSLSPALQRSFHSFRVLSHQLSDSPCSARGMFFLLLICPLTLIKTPYTLIYLDDTCAWERIIYFSSLPGMLELNDC